MTKITIDIDTEANELGSKEKDKVTILASEKRIAFLASITPADDLVNSFAVGLNNTLDSSVQVLGVGYDGDTIRKNHGDLIKKNVIFITTAGGSVVFDAIKDVNDLYNKPYISLLGSEPITQPKSNAPFLGGVSLQSWQSNIERLNLLVAKGHTLDNIYLYCNPISAMNQSEEDNWNKINPQTTPTIIEFSGANRAKGTNDPTKFNADFNTASIIPSNATGVVISADPFFQQNRSDLVAAVNTWLSGDGARYTIYPSLMFNHKADPRGGQSTLYGPDLQQAYRLLGILARVVLADQAKHAVGLYPIGNQSMDIPP